MTRTRSDTVFSKATELFYMLVSDVSEAYLFQGASGRRASGCIWLEGQAIVIPRSTRSKTKVISVARGRPTLGAKHAPAGAAAAV